MIGFAHGGIMPRQRKTRRELAKMIANRLGNTQVQVTGIHRDMDGTWCAITVGDAETIGAVQPRIDAIVAELRGSCELVNGDPQPSVAVSTPRARKWLGWVRRRKTRTERYE
jgi:hypothetical protein